MLASDPNDLVRIFQAVISPVALISGVGLLILAMTNRFAHTTDRARELSKQHKVAGEDDARHLSVQIRILYGRLRIQLLAITLAIVSVFFAALLIVVLFALYLASAELEKVAVTLFGLSLLSLVLSLTFFIRDLSLSLGAIKDEISMRI